MSGNRDEFACAHRSHPRARAVAVPQQDQRIVRMVACALATAIIVMWMAYLSSVAASVVTRLGVASSHVTASEAINRLHKADRLVATKLLGS